MKYFKKYDKTNYYLAILFSAILYPACNLFLALVLKRLVDAGLAKDSNELIKSIIICLLVCLLLAFSVFLSDLTKNKFVLNFSKNYRKDIFNKIIASDLTEFNDNNIGTFISTMTSNITNIEEKYVKSFFKLILNYSLLIFSIFGMFWINWKLSIPVLIICLLPIFIMGAICFLMC